ncbi:hypothetical protein OEZ86_014700 [Tetradesmus obliquus]|nr:hypothetical protein OEZ86_014700 [Tetradesmus obliquus]
MENKRKVSYFYDAELGDFYYGPTHPMKPHRVRMAHDLIVRYDLYKHLQVYTPVPCPFDDMCSFHSREYLEGLKSVDAPKSGDKRTDKAQQERLRNDFNLGVADCPVFANIFKYCQAYTGASIGAAVQLNYGQADICINWAGGLHHARKGRASGFCYINDIVLAILELLKYHRRVLYLDIDVHHGDGVEEAFYTTDRVMTVSFHKYDGEFFPGTGDLDEVGAGPGRYYAINVPLSDGMDDESYEGLFVPIMDSIMANYQPDAIVLQSGADSLTGDRLGKFNLTIQGHARCHGHMMRYGLPLLVLGGGGYKIVNVARCWTYETAVLTGQAASMRADMPPNEYYELFKPDHSLFIPKDDAMTNENSRARLDQLRATILENLRHVRPVSGDAAVTPNIPAAAAAAMAKQQQAVARQRWESTPSPSDPSGARGSASGGRWSEDEEGGEAGMDDSADTSN